MSTAAPPPPPKAGHGTAEEIEKPPESVQMTDAEELDAASDRDHSDSGKLKTLMGILKRMVGVKDIAAVRLSLPANLLEPCPNLEYWTYLARGDIVSSISELEDPLDRMLQTLRFTFTKELKFVHGKICKPYNSILGEHFRCHWDVQGLKTAPDGGLIPVQGLRTQNVTPMATSVASGLSASSSSAAAKKAQRESGGGGDLRPTASRAASTTSTATASTVGGGGSTDDGSGGGGSKRKGLSKLIGRDKVSSKLSSGGGGGGGDGGSSKSSVKSPMLGPKKGGEDDDGTASLSGGVDKLSLGEAEGNFKRSSGGNRRFTFLTEQVSHHPPISSFFYECKDTGIQMYGVDQLSAKFTGTAVRVFPGEYNKGIFIKLTDSGSLGSLVAGEEYQVTHPTASINGLLRGSLWVAICDTLYVTCRGGSNTSNKRLRTVVEYKDESWLMKAKYALEAVIYEYDANEDGADEQYRSIREAPGDKVVATVEGTWRGRITWKRKGEKESKLLIDLDELDTLPKTVRPLESQEEMESRKIWQPVTKSILDKEFSAATKHKQVIEQRQREAAAERKRVGTDFKPRFFEEDIADGRPHLTEAGRKAIDDEGNLVGYSSGQNTAEVSKQMASENATKAGGVSGGGGGGGVRVDDDDGDDDDDFDDAKSFKSAQ